MVDMATWTNAALLGGGLLAGGGVRWGVAKATVTALRADLAKLQTAVATLSAGLKDLADLKHEVENHNKVLFADDRSLNVMTIKECDKSKADYRQQICSKLDDIKKCQASHMTTVDKSLREIFDWIRDRGEQDGEFKAHLKEHDKKVVNYAQAGGGSG